MGPLHQEEVTPVLRPYELRGTLWRKVKHWTASLNFISCSRADEDRTLGSKYKMIRRTVRHSSEKCHQSQFLSCSNKKHFSLTFHPTCGNIPVCPPLAKYTTTKLSVVWYRTCVSLNFVLCPSQSPCVCPFCSTSSYCRHNYFSRKPRIIAATAPNSLKKVAQLKYERGRSISFTSTHRNSRN